ncbi:MAG TPA: L,D-transpeptidase [Jatrophihabitantaceae bacterium]|nr:L,D-transpeptidase [Jatrophihabitantaceae bacterium]
MTKLSSARRARRLCGLVVASALAAGLLAACSTSGSPSTPKTVFHTVTAGPTGSSAPASGQPSTAPNLPQKTVRVTSLESDGSTYGVGMPIVLYFSPAPTDSTAFTKAVQVTVNGAPAGGAWFWEQPTADEKKTNTIEAHYRPKTYWPGHAQIHVGIPIGGLSAGNTKHNSLVYSGKLTSLDFNIGAAHVSTVNAATHSMAVTSDGKPVKTIKVSLGEAQTPTYSGVKVVMQKGEDAPGTDKLRPDGAVRMVGPGYDEIVDWSVRITESGEYVHAAPWNSEIGLQSTSNGCTNLFTADAEWFYKFSNIGDVVQYPRTDGTLMPSWDGYGDWNLPWGVWSRGGLLLNH